MFERLKTHDVIIVTGPHRSGTTIAAEMIAADTGKRMVREEAFEYRDIRAAQEIVQAGDCVIQGPYLLPWLPILNAYPVYINRSHSDIGASLEVLRKKGMRMPFFTAAQALAIWQKMNLGESVEYESLRQHPLWVNNRAGWGHRQTTR